MEGWLGVDGKAIVVANGRGGIRTRTPVARKGILSPLCLPVPPRSRGWVHYGPVAEPRRRIRCVFLATVSTQIDTFSKAL